jgi:tetratricopeptide (TPR) repeat protein
LKALEIIKRNFEEDHVIYVKHLENLSSILIHLGNYEEAKQGYLKALDTIKRIYGEENVKYAYILEDLSIVLWVLGDYEGAKNGC